ncbi:MAG: DNA translocase FtsK 4TM domain-containing protein, partial [Rhodothermales bacterium]|nr:DNA translocase FtsK 4TM domain-containing protein [Rhodothermales bacterium]
MSGTTTRKKRRKKPKQADAAFVPHERKKEVLGLVLMVLALLLALALVTYDPADDALAQGFTWADLVEPGGAPAGNALGLLGAWIARGLVPGFLGYPVVLVAGVVFAWGYVLFRRRRAVFLPLLSGLLVVAAVLGAVLVGWFADGGDPVLTRWSGDVGLGVAGWMKHVLGAAGSLILLLLAAAVLLLLFIDRDIQVTLDRVEDAFGRLTGRTREKLAEAREASAARAEARAAARAERRAR